MIKQLLLPLAAVAVFIVLVGLLVKNSGNISIPGIASPTPGVQTQTIKVGGGDVNVEVAKTGQERELGLDGRDSLEDNHGMLFVFDSQNVTPSFWMKDMKFPLDIIWINDGKVVKVDKNVQPPKVGVQDSDLAIYSPGQPIDYVLEVNGGYSDKNNLKVGDSVNLGPALP